MDWPQEQQFTELVNQHNIHGLHFQHVDLCETRCWLYHLKINFAQWDPLVQEGIASHHKRFERDKSTRGLFGIMPDRIDWDEKVVFEHKLRPGAKRAVELQIAFYCAMLSIATKKNWIGRIHILSTKRSYDVVLTKNLLRRLWTSAQRIARIVQQEKPPTIFRKPLCEKCSAFHFCGSGQWKLS